MTSLARKESVVVDSQEFLAAECIGKFGVKETDGDVGRMFRCVYDAGDRVKVVWDSEGNVYRVSVKCTPSTRNSKEEMETVPDWASEQFETPISVYRESAVAGTAPGESPSQEATQRLEELGYL